MYGRGPNPRYSTQTTDAFVQYTCNPVMVWTYAFPSCTKRVLAFTLREPQILSFQIDSVIIYM